MAKAAYVGVSNTAKKIKKMYIGVNGVPKKVIKGYVGVNGVPKVFWGASLDSWDFWVTTSGYISDLGVNKTSNLIAYYAAVKVSGGGKKALLMSPSSSAVAYDNYTYQGSVTDGNGITWYYNMQGGTSGSNCLLSNDEYSSASDAAQDLLYLIYNIPFHANYQVGQTYTRFISSTEKTVRKLVGAFLFLNMGYYSSHSAYTAFSDNIVTIYQNILSDLDYIDETIFEVSILFYDGGNVIKIRISQAITMTTREGLIESKDTALDYDYTIFDSGATSIHDIYYRSKTVTVDSNGNISYGSKVTYSTSDDYVMGVKCVTTSYGTYSGVNISGHSLGVDY